MVPFRWFRWFRWFRSGGYAGSGGSVPVVSFRCSGFYHMPYSHTLLILFLIILVRIAGCITCCFSSNFLVFASMSIFISGQRERSLWESDRPRGKCSGMGLLEKVETNL